MLDETGYAGPEHLDAADVAGYEAKAQYDPTPDVDAVLAAGIGADSVVVDLGAGTGVFTRAMAPHVRRVVAVDVSPAMISALSRWRGRRRRVGQRRFRQRIDLPVVDRLTERSASEVVG